MAVIFLKENLNTRVRGRKDLENLNVPFVGEIPLEGRKLSFFGRLRKTLGHQPERKETRQILVKEKSRNMINEAFRVVRTNLEFVMGSGSGAKVIMVTSMNPDSGKTFVISNLAACFAIKNKKTVLIDLDLRKATLSGYVGNPKTGVSNLLAGQETSAASIIVKDNNIPSLDIIPVGTIPPNPAELLFSERLGQLIDELKKGYDYIFIDCPPIDIVADTQIIEKQSDYTLFVVRAGLLERDMLPELQRYYDEKRFKNMALVLNGTEGGGSRYGYRYGYKYGYNYGYGKKSYYGNSKD